MQRIVQAEGERFLGWRQEEGFPGTEKRINKALWARSTQRTLTDPQPLPPW
jgi:hypothetical protein